MNKCYCPEPEIIEGNPNCKKCGGSDPKLLPKKKTKKQTKLT